MKPFRDEVFQAVAVGVYMALHLEALVDGPGKNILDEAYHTVNSDVRAHAITSQVTTQIMRVVRERML